MAGIARTKSRRPTRLHTKGDALRNSQKEREEHSMDNVANAGKTRLKMLLG